MASKLRLVSIIAVSSALLVALTACSSNKSSDSYNQGWTAGQWLVNGDAFYDPINSRTYLDQMCETNYENDSATVSNKSEYLQGCRAGFDDAENN